jgi:hypothetical protein
LFSVDFGGGWELEFAVSALPEDGVPVADRVAEREDAAVLLVLILLLQKI